LAIDPAVASILGGQNGDAQEGAEREGKRRSTTPHERERTGRRVAVSFPDEAWVGALQEQAERWGMRVSDLVVFCVAHTMAGIEAGEVRKPAGETRFYHRAGEGLDLGWEPG